ncbi:TPA: hypothetical protein ACH3X3_005895 [Trebouxia sp. C0006]
MAGRQDHSVGGGGMDPEVALKDQVDLTHAGDKEAEKFKPREDDYDATSKHAAGSSGEKAATGAAQAQREAGSSGTHDSIAASTAAGVKAATEGK